VEERNLNSLGTPPAAANGMMAAPASNPNAGQPGYYTVKPGDTLIRVGLETGQSWRDIVAWNNIENPNVLEVGQVLRVVPPAASATVASTSPISTARVESRPLDARAPAAAASGPAPTPATGGPPAAPAAPAAPATTPPVPATPVASGPAREVDDINWTWPAAGAVVASFDDARNKGLGIAGKPGDPIFAAADGKVVYAGSGLRGYGNLVIVKHNNSYLTAYAHNQALLVKEDQTVRRGQKIAEMGSTDADRVKLHFEIRKEGKPVDPARYLPPR
jgi:lipoprotein NlpD